MRGYRDGTSYGDSGWRMQLEPHTPWINLGMVDGTLPLLVRAYGFFDCGQTWLSDAPRNNVKLAGIGIGANATIGSHLDLRFQIAVPLRATPANSGEQPFEHSGDVRVTFGIGAQF